MSLAPPVSRDGFAYAGRDLYAEASGQNRHRRATPAELREHFASSSGSSKDHPAHWFEAQLMHYGLPVSKTKAVARMRLFDAVNSGALVVPDRVLKLEAELKKEWNKNEREAKKSMKSGGDNAKSGGAAGTKRKAEAASSNNVDVVINVGGIDIKVSANNNTAASSSSASAAKKAKTTTATKSAAATTAKAKAPAAAKPSPSSKAASTTTPAKTEPKAPAAVSKPTPAPKAKTSTSSVKKEPSSTATPKPKPKKEEDESKPINHGSRTKQTAIRGGLSQAPSTRDVKKEESPSPPLARSRNPQMARRGAIRGALPRGPTSNVKLESDNNNWDTSNQYDPSLPPLGLINGRYDVSPSPVCPYSFSEYDSHLILTIAGTGLWGKFLLDNHREGIFWVQKRPVKSSTNWRAIAWRARDISYSWTQGEHLSGDGCIRFVGDGKVEVSLVQRPDLMPKIEAYRGEGQGTRSEVDATTMWRLWEELE
ncbi:hypothetical protein F5Y16DRAFT_385028 [Xylariaceae sp. FL0255]|nr:hypothetical protein F5Y16DRAFT_385028 [Xylariaceae sp. FL0255]